MSLIVEVDKNPFHAQLKMLHIMTYRRRMFFNLIIYFHFIIMQRNGILIFLMSKNQLFGQVFGGWKMKIKAS